MEILTSIFKFGLSLVIMFILMMIVSKILKKILPKNNKNEELDSEDED